MILKESTSLEGLLYFGCCYMAIIMIWYEKLAWDARFAPDDNIFHRLTELVHHVILGMAIQHVRPVSLMKYTCRGGGGGGGGGGDDNEDSNNNNNNTTTLVFVSCLSVLYALHVGLYADLVVRVEGGPEAVHQAWHDVRRKVLGGIPVWTAMVWAARDYYYNDSTTTCAQEGNPWPVVLVGLPFFVEQAFMLVETLVLHATQDKSHKQVRVPMNLEFTIHRLGEWVMLMLGESVLSLIIVEASPGRRYVVTFCAGMVAVTMMQYLYFRTNPLSADDHAMRRSIAGGYQFFYGLIIYSACLILMGCSFKLILHQYLEENELHQAGELDNDAQEELADAARRITNMFSWSLTSAFFFMDLMLVSHRGWKSNLGRM
eukprot:scaffold34970_cov244-Amphora_coffeaeformis.AAC.1